MASLSSRGKSAFSPIVASKKYVLGKCGKKSGVKNTPLGNINELMVAVGMQHPQKTLDVVDAIAAQGFALSERDCNELLRLASGCGGRGACLAHIGVAELQKQFGVLLEMARSSRKPVMSAGGVKVAQAWCMAAFACNQLSSDGTTNPFAQVVWTNDNNKLLTALGGLSTAAAQSLDLELVRGKKKPSGMLNIPPGKRSAGQHPADIMVTLVDGSILGISLKAAFDHVAPTVSNLGQGGPRSAYDIKAYQDEIYVYANMHAYASQIFNDESPDAMAKLVKDDPKRCSGRYPAGMAYLRGEVKKMEELSRRGSARERKAYVKKLEKKKDDAMRAATRDVVAKIVEHANKNGGEMGKMVLQDFLHIQPDNLPYIFLAAGGNEVYAINFKEFKEILSPDAAQVTCSQQPQQYVRNNPNNGYRIKQGLLFTVQEPGFRLPIHVELDLRVKICQRSKGRTLKINVTFPVTTAQTLATRFPLKSGGAASVVGRWFFSGAHAVATVAGFRASQEDDSDSDDEDDDDYHRGGDGGMHGGGGSASLFRRQITSIVDVLEKLAPVAHTLEGLEVPKKIATWVRSANQRKEEAIWEGGRRRHTHRKTRKKRRVKRRKTRRRKHRRRRRRKTRRKKY